MLIVRLDAFHAMDGSAPLFNLGMLRNGSKTNSSFYFGNSSIIPFPQITIKDNIGNRNIEIIFSSFLNHILNQQHMATYQNVHIAEK
ncbi:hypothetical protein BGV40_14630 [Methanosarcina sp. Ant1]|nr:hypothetical protein BGV40_14630 [Methanosarcina sp. Ant1]